LPAEPGRLLVRGGNCFKGLEKFGILVRSELGTGFLRIWESLTGEGRLAPTLGAGWAACGCCC
jgi:hypothetical protein